MAKTVFSPEMQSRVWAMFWAGVTQKAIREELGIGRTPLRRLLLERVGITKPPKKAKAKRPSRKSSSMIPFEPGGRYKCEPCSERNNNATFTNVRPCVECAVATFLK